MVSKPLLKQSIKANALLWAVSCVIVCVIIAMMRVVMKTSQAASFKVDFVALSPYIAALWSKGLSINGMIAAIGLDGNLLDNMQSLDINVLLNTMFYNIGGVLIPMLYSVIAANNLMASQVDRGSMAFILSTPVKRSAVVFTQTLFLVASLFIMFVLTACADLAASAVVGLEINVAVTFLLNLGLFLLMFATSGLCFMFASIFNLSKISYAAGGGLCVLFYICKVLGIFGNKAFVNLGMGLGSMRVFDYFSLISLLDTESICYLTTPFIWKFAILAGIGIATFTVANLFFRKKDLPL